MKEKKREKLVKMLEMTDRKRFQAWLIEHGNRHENGNIDYQETAFKLFQFMWKCYEPREMKGFYCKNCGSQLLENVFEIWCSNSECDFNETKDSLLYF
ncbi:MAG: hypothetical protein ACTSUK_03665 [Promethearchaeota archaeon]